MSPSETSRIGYVLKMYPRFSETFIVNEILAHEAAGAELEIFSLRPPVDGRFHASLAQVRAPVTYLRSGSLKAAEAWEVLGTGIDRLPCASAELDELLAADVGDAVQAVELALLVQERGLVHLHAHFGSVSTTVARLASRLTGVPYSFTAHAKDIFHTDVDPQDLHRKLRDAAGVVTVSDFNLDYLRQAYGAAAGTVRRVYNGLDLQDFGYSEPLERLPVISTVGRLVEKKGFGDLVTACGLLRDRGVDFRCEIVGSGPEEKGLRAHVKGLALSRHVALLGPRPQDQVKQLIRGAAVFAVPCVIGTDGNRDGLPTVLLEAMALGTPCVSTDVTGIPEILHDGVTGLAVPQHDPRRLADALERLLADAALRVRLAGQARALIERDFDIHRQAALVREVLSAASVQPPLEVASA